MEDNVSIVYKYITDMLYVFISELMNVVKSILSGLRLAVRFKWILIILSRLGLSTEYFNKAILHRICRFSLMEHS